MPFSSFKKRTQTQKGMLMVLLAFCIQIGIVGSWKHWWKAPKICNGSCCREGGKVQCEGPNEGPAGHCHACHDMGTMFCNNQLLYSQCTIFSQCMHHAPCGMMDQNNGTYGAIGGVFAVGALAALARFFWLYRKGIPKEHIEQAKTKMKRNAIVAAIVCVICFGVAGNLQAQAAALWWAPGVQGSVGEMANDMYGSAFEKIFLGFFWWWLFKGKSPVFCKICTRDCCLITCMIDQQIILITQIVSMAACGGIEAWAQFWFKDALALKCISHALSAWFAINLTRIFYLLYKHYPRTGCNPKKVPQEAYEEPVGEPVAVQKTDEANATTLGAAATPDATIWATTVAVAEAPVAQDKEAPAAKENDV